MTLSREQWQIKTKKMKFSSDPLPLFSIQSHLLVDYDITLDSFKTIYCATKQKDKKNKKRRKSCHAILLTSYIYKYQQDNHDTQTHKIVGKFQHNYCMYTPANTCFKSPPLMWILPASLHMCFTWWSSREAFSMETSLSRTIFSWPRSISGNRTALGFF